VNRIIGNRVAERDIRDWLNEHGYIGNSAQIEDLELHAISRPGWIQVFRFRASVKQRSSESDPEISAERREYFGVSRDDERKTTGRKTEVILLSNAEQQREQLVIWSADLIVRSSANSLAIFWFVIVVLLGFIAMAAIVSLVT